MKRSTGLHTKKIVFSALMAALTSACSGLRIVLPLEIAGTTAFHLGNIMCALSGILLGPWLGGIAAGLGSAIFDMLHPLYISEAWITFLLKGVYGLIAGLIIRCGKQPWGYGRALLAAIGGACTYAVLYLVKSYFYNGLLLSGLAPAVAWVNVVTKLPATIFNGAVAILAAPVLAVTLRHALKQSHLTLD